MRSLQLWILSTGRGMVARGKEAHKGEGGAIDIGGILLMGIGMVFLAVGFIMFPIVTDATDDLLSYVYSGNASITDATFTGFTPIIGITPLLILLGFLSAAVFSMYLGVRIMKGGEGGTKLDLGTILMLGIAMIFIAIGLIILPVTLDGISSVLTGDGSGLNSALSHLFFPQDRNTQGGASQTGIYYLP